MALHNRRFFLKRAAIAPLGVSAMLGMCNTLPVHPAKAASNGNKINVLLLLTDDQSAHLECLGTRGIHTPVTTQLAKEGVLFTNAFATCTSCSPARSGILTGMHPHSNGHWRNTHTPEMLDPDVDYSRRSKYAKVEPVGVHEDIPTLIEVLNGAGYETAITNKFHLSPVWKYPFKHRIEGGYEVKHNEKLTGEFFDQCGDKPFFMLANVAHTHRPFSHHIVKTGYPKVDPELIDVPANLADTPAMRDDLATYFETVQGADACTGGILNALKRSGKYDNTLIIFTSDQGYCYHRAKATAYDLGLRVPMIISGPGIKKNLTRKHLVSHVDLMPTILEMLSVETPETVQGLSLKPLLQDGEVEKWRQYVCAEHNSHGPPEAEYYPIRSAFDGRFHYLRNLLSDKKRWTGDLEALLEKKTFPPELLYAGPTDAFQRAGWDNHSFEATIRAKDEFPVQYQLLRDTFARPAEELYDLHTDPFEIHNLAEDPRFQKQLIELRQVTDQWMKETGDPGVNLNKTPRRQ